MNRKPRLLMVGEASFMKTGFSKISMEILSRLHRRGNVEVAELGAYGKSSDPRARALPWTFYGGIPEDHDRFAIDRANSTHFYRIYSQFGANVFEQACVDFRPDVVFDIRDRWMTSAWQLHSPYRRYFKYLLCPTVDGEPQRLEWVDEYRKADSLLVYSEYAKKTLEREAPGLSVFDVLRPGVNHDVFKPMDKAKARNELGLEQDCNIILSVMRNQKRKLFPDLIESFAMFLKRCKQEGKADLAKKTYLYLHTSYPDVGYDLQSFIMKEGLGHKVLCTYICRKCGTFYPSFFAGEIAPCRRCSSLSAFMPNTNSGITDEQLALIYNASDVYVQMSICEGLAMPPIEARACEVPAFCTDYSAIADQAHEPGGFPIKVERFFYETVIETEQARALPSKSDLVDGLFGFFAKPSDERKAIGRAGREYVVANYTFDRATDIVENAILSMAPEMPDHSLTWMNPIADVRNAPSQIPNSLNNSDFVDWCILNVIRQPEWLWSFWRDELIKSLNTGQMNAEGTRQYIKFNREECYNYMLNKANEISFFEKYRVNAIMPQKQQRNIVEVV